MIAIDYRLWTIVMNWLDYHIMWDKKNSSSKKDIKDRSIKTLLLCVSIWHIKSFLTILEILKKSSFPNHHHGAPHFEPQSLPHFPSYAGLIDTASAGLGWTWMNLKPWAMAIVAIGCPYVKEVSVGHWDMMWSHLSSDVQVILQLYFKCFFLNVPL